MEGRDVPWRDHAFCQRAMGSRMLRTARYKYSYGLRPRLLALYDLEADPLEDRNLAREPAHAGTVRRMHARLREVMASDGDPLAARLPQDPLA
jgi:arylsulfatase A-like enzyme